MPWRRSRVSVVGIATGYRVDDRGVEVRVPVGARTFPSPRRPQRGLFPPPPPPGTKMKVNEVSVSKFPRAPSFLATLFIINPTVCFLAFARRGGTRPFSPRGHHTPHLTTFLVAAYRRTEQVGSSDLNLNMEAICCSEMSVDFQWISQRYIAEYNHRCENL
jgi:hypothetical protein